ncbi:MAG: energy transducer TonB, partial [Chthoniobacterales bacterium]
VNAERDAAPADTALAMAPEGEATPEPEAALILEPEMLSEDDPVARAALFATATPLPDIDQLRPLPPFRADASGPLVVQFQINSSGKITDLEQVTITTVTESEESEADTTETAASPQLEENPAVDRLLRKMRRIRFRPAYKAGEAVETDMIVCLLTSAPPVIRRWHCNHDEANNQGFWKPPNPVPIAWRHGHGVRAFDAGGVPLGQHAHYALNPHAPFHAFKFWRVFAELRGYEQPEQLQHQQRQLRVE